MKTTKQTTKSQSQTRTTKASTKKAAAKKRAEKKPVGKINGVDVAALQEMIADVKADPKLGKSQWRNRNRWIDGAHNRSTFKSFYAAGKEDATRTKPFVYENDEPPVLLGQNRAPNPVEWVLHGLAGCVTTTLVYYAGVMGMELDSVETELDGDIDLRGMLGISKEVPSGYREIRLRFKIEGKDVTDQQRKQLMELARKHSPVFGTVATAVPVITELAH